MEYIILAIVLVGIICLVVLLYVFQKFKVVLIDETVELVIFIRRNRVIGLQSPLVNKNRSEFLGWSNKEPKSFFLEKYYDGTVNGLLLDFESLKIKKNQTFYSVWRPKNIEEVFDENTGCWQYRVYEIDGIFRVVNQLKEIINFNTFRDAMHYIERKKKGWSNAAPDYETPVY